MDESERSHGIKMGIAGIHGPPIWSKFLKGNAGVHEPPI